MTKNNYTDEIWYLPLVMMTPSNGNIFRVTGSLCGKFTGYRWIPLTKASDAEVWCFFFICAWINGWVRNRDAGDLRRHRAHSDVIVMVVRPPGREKWLLWKWRLWAMRESQCEISRLSPSKSPAIRVIPNIAPYFHWPVAYSVCNTKWQICRNITRVGSSPYHRILFINETPFIVMITLIKDEPWLWWRHQMEAFSALLALCAGNSPVTGEFPAQRPVTRSFDVFFDLRLSQQLSKQSRRWWFETPSRSLWRHCNDNRCVLISFIQVTGMRFLATNMRPCTLNSLKPSDVYMRQ